ncbi:hypothetical protein Taro_018533 [Colocasia esculenta]|uniref:Uncharacterized protein n=1 Tax=Colocasia esculenta TaxID=4460 RepID=A0A843UZF1_COLES|nr:hypothetical protein [Colocasia esculenta]
MVRSDCWGGPCGVSQQGYVEGSYVLMTVSRQAKWMASSLLVASVFDRLKPIGPVPGLDVPTRSVVSSANMDSQTDCRGDVEYKQQCISEKILREQNTMLGKMLKEKEVAAASLAQQVQWEQQQQQNPRAASGSPSPPTLDLEDGPATTLNIG